MTINPVALGIGAGAATAVGVGLGLTHITDRIADKHPNGSDADGPAAGWTIGAGALGFLATGAGMFASAKGNPLVGAGLIGAGIGAMIGTVGGGIAFSARHGVGVETQTSRFIRDYDHNWNGQLDLDSGSWWQGPETIRRERREWEDSHGHRRVDYDIYTIDRLANHADANRDRVATREELRATIGGYDANGDDRLQGDEARRFDRELGERRIY